MRLALLLAVACGSSTPPTFAPVVAVLDYTARPNPTPYLSMAANLQLNPACAANCELGDAFPDGGGSRAWMPASGAVQDVAIGAMIEVAIGNADPATCAARRRVEPGGMMVTATVRGDSSCSFAFAP